MTVAKTSTKIYFEHPLNDQMRICLRLERLFAKLLQNMNHPDKYHSQMALKALIQIIDVIDRPDLKSKLSLALTQNGDFISTA